MLYFSSLLFIFFVSRYYIQPRQLLCCSQRRSAAFHNPSLRYGQLHQVRWYRSQQSHSAQRKTSPAGRLEALLLRKLHPFVRPRRCEAVQAYLRRHHSRRCSLEGTSWWPALPTLSLVLPDQSRWYNHTECCYVKRYYPQVSDHLRCWTLTVA